MRAINRNRIKLLAVPLMAVAVALLAWGHAGSQQTAAQEGKPTMSLEVAGEQGGSPVVCNSAAQSKCTIDLGSQFTLSVVPGPIGAGGYGGWQTLIDYGNLTYKPGPGENKWDLSFLPVRSPSSPSGKEGQVGHGDVSNFFPPLPLSLQKTAFLNLTFHCAGNNKTPGENFSTFVSMISFNVNPAGTAFIDENGSAVIANLGEITINCEDPPVGGLSVDLAGDETGLPLEAAQSSGTNAGLLAGVIAAISAVAITVTGAAWYARRRLIS